MATHYSQLSLSSQSSQFKQPSHSNFFKGLVYALLHWLVTPSGPWLCPVFYCIFLSFIPSFGNPFKPQFLCPACKVFQHDLYQLRLAAAWAYMTALETSANPVSSWPEEPTRKVVRGHKEGCVRTQGRLCEDNKKVCVRT